MRHFCSNVVRCWGTRPTLRLSGYLWVAARFGVLALLEANRIGVFLVPPFGATLTILMLLPDAPVAQPYALIVGSVCGAAVGTGISFLGSGLGMAVLAHDRCVCRHQPDSRLPPSRSSPGIDSRPTSSGSLVSCARRASFHPRSRRICGGNE
jgi:hypothetical protein